MTKFPRDIYQNHEVKYSIVTFLKKNSSFISIKWKPTVYQYIKVSMFQQLVKKNTISMLKNKGIKTFIISLILKTSVINYCDFQMDIQTLDSSSTGTSRQEFILQEPPKCPDAFLIYLGRKLWNLIICNHHFFCLSRPSFWSFLKPFLKLTNLNSIKCQWAKNCLSLKNDTKSGQKIS